MNITEMDKTFPPRFGDLISFSHLYKSGFDTKIEIPPEKSHPMSTTKSWASVSSLFPPWPVGHLHFGLPVIAPSARHARIIHIHILKLSKRDWLVVSTPLKNISQIGNLPQIGVKIKKYLKPLPR